MQGNISLDGKNCFSCPKIQGQNPRHLFIDTYIDTFLLSLITTFHIFLSLLGESCCQQTHLPILFYQITSWTNKCDCTSLMEHDGRSSGKQQIFWIEVFL